MKPIWIVDDDQSRRVVVVSAPGKRNSADAKITDLLYRCHASIGHEADFDAAFDTIAERYRGIVADLGVGVPIDAALDAVRDGILAGRGADFAASRGEYLNARIAAALLDAEFVDAAEMLLFDSHGRLEIGRAHV